jgi:Holliday junction resolvasome RuvABC ATP-dependent DNA helicase subunit
MQWKELVGQEKAKSRLDFHFEAAKTGEALPSFMFCGPRGFGKTAIGEAFGLRVKELTGGTKRFFSLNCASVKNLKQFWNSIVVPIINDRDVTILFDEASELPMGVTMALLTMINPNENNRNSYTYEDMTIDIDMKRQSFMFATTEPHKVFHALMNRCRRIDLEDYSHTDLSTILKRNAKAIKFNKDALEQVAPTLRGNARGAVDMAKDIASYLAPLKKTEFGVEDWTLLSRRLDIKPLGVNPIELRVLRVLEQRRDCSLTRIAASLGLSAAAVQKDYELYLQKHGLMEITTNGRNLTPQGQEYLKQLNLLQNPPLIPTPAKK